MTLTDAGPLVALVNRGDTSHARCVASLAHVRLPMITTWPAFTEAMYLLGAAAGWNGQAPLWRMVARGQLVLRDTSARMLDRMPELMEKYRDLPMDLADASLVALAEEAGLVRIFTLDGQFRIYRLPRNQSFLPIP